MSFHSRQRVTLTLLAGLAMLGCGGAEEAPPAAESEAPPVAESGGMAEAQGSIRIASPADGAEVTSPVAFVLEADGVDIVPAGVEQANSGHHHLLVNMPVPAAGVPVPTTDGYHHYGQAQTEMTLELPPGEHTITAVLGDHLHRVLDPSVDHSIRIVVR